MNKKKNRIFFSVFYGKERSWYVASASMVLLMSKAFNTVNHGILLKDIFELPLNSRIKRFLASY